MKLQYLGDAYTDFMLSRQAMQCSKNTLRFYNFTAYKFLWQLENRGVTKPEEITARHVRQYLAELSELGKADTTIHDHARAIRTLLKFWYAEGYMNVVSFDMPRVAKKKLPVLSAEELTKVINTCETKRDRALVYFMADSGLRRAEICALNWGDVDMQSGLVTVKRGKGGKARSSVVSATTRRALLKYRRTLANSAPTAPLFQSFRGKGRLTGSGITLIFRRLSALSGIHVTPHSLRRTFTILSLRAGMSVLHLQNLGGWSSLDMVNHYSQMADEDLLAAHSEHSPIENL